VGKKMFVVRQEKNARQTISLSCVEVKTHNKQFFAERFFFAVRHGEDALPCAREKNARQRFSRTANSGFHVVDDTFMMNFQAD
jgi:hypothetical protein